MILAGVRPNYKLASMTRPLAASPNGEGGGAKDSRLRQVSLDTFCTQLGIMGTFGCNWCDAVAQDLTGPHRG